MPSPVAHTLAGWCIAEAVGGRAGRSHAVTAAVLAAAVLPDADFLPALLGLDPGQSFHQGPTHSLFFVLAAAAPLALALRGRLGFAAAWATLALSGAAHLLLDIVTADLRAPYGIPLLWPLDDGRWHSPLSLFPRLERSSLSAALGAANALALAVEVAWFLLPAGLLLGRRAARGARP